MKLIIGDKSYPWKGYDHVPLIHQIRLQQQNGLGPNQIRQMYREQQALTDQYEAEKEIAEKEGRPLPEEPSMDMILLGITVWACRVSAGEKVSFEEACDITDFRFEAEPGDSNYEEKPDPTGAAAKPRKSSAKSQRQIEAVA